MPGVHEAGGFRIYIYLPPSEHGPPHVHVLKAGGEVVVQIGTSAALRPLRVTGTIKHSEIVLAVRIVESMERDLLLEWRKYHGW